MTTLADVKFSFATSGSMRENLGTGKNPRFEAFMLDPRPNTQAQLSIFATDETDIVVPAYEERPLHLGTADAAIAHLRAIDLSFTDDDTRFLGHDLHPYPAKFIPQLPGTFVSLLSSRGELVFDPFGGSGTTALEAIRLGRRAVSLDANPVAALIGRVKTARVSAEATAELHLLHGALRALLPTLPRNPAETVAKYAQFAPLITNREKWFPDSSFGELAHIRQRIAALEDNTAKDIVSLALSRTVLAASFQDSETRYKSVPRDIPVGETTKRFIREFELVMRSVARNAAATRYGVSYFLTGDVRAIPKDGLPDGSVDLIVTSPPYGNAMDYHLYHRFRLLWLGHDPIAFGKLEIGSHLKHQRESSGFDTYHGDMMAALEGMSRVLKRGRYAVLVIGDSVYEGTTYDTARILAGDAERLGFDAADVFEREVHKIKRSFTPAGRRASKESILVLRKKEGATRVLLQPPPYKLWPYEQALREREVGTVEPQMAIEAGVADLVRCRSMVFTHKVEFPSGHSEPTWQAILENGMASNPAARKDPKYVTHGLHPYKGKFYPQLAKALINQLSLPLGSRILDPFCGSGTTLLEGYLNGYSAFGCDVHPLAAKIAKAKSNVLDEDPDVFTEVVSSVLEALEGAPAKLPNALDQFNPECMDEICNWFAAPVARKLNWLLRTIRAGSEGVSRDFLEVVFSSIVRDVSQQEPSDLRIRYRKEMLEDADVLGLFRQQLVLQFSRIEKFWKVRGYAPNAFHPVSAIVGDNRAAATYDALGLSAGTVDMVLTSPPYAMALPYIDTDRLSLLTLFGLGGTRRRPIEQALIGSREISTGLRRRIEETFQDDGELPRSCLHFVRDLHGRISKSDDAGFRKQNMPALIHRFLSDMQAVFVQLHRLCKVGAEAMVVIGDSRMTVDEKEVRIPSTDLVEDIAEACGFRRMGRIDISVTTENLVHIKNAITENVVLRLRKDG
ncbi:DNA methyltransferase [Burkholderia vietnamiensis]|uniref:DNA methyltransferase n=1 Tax=Burkholderia vietnamiensis TaxID=60552 RepID=UPI00158A83D4|nr:DNA methyltransferase [Burkholderia vietnamiensis]